MPKNVTVQVGDDLATRMENLPDVNWSHVVRDCIERYCNIRLNADIEALAQKMKEQKEESYSEGYKTALEWFKLESVRYEDVDKVSREWDETTADFDRHIEEKYGSFEQAEDDGISVNTLWEREKRGFWTKTLRSILEELPYDCDVTDAFIEGFRNALLKLETSG